jgi:hypothetical protein
MGPLLAHPNQNYQPCLEKEKEAAARRRAPPLLPRLDFELGANSPRLLVGQSTYFMAARTSLLNELVLPTIKKVVAPLEVGPTFAFN